MHPFYFPIGRDRPISIDEWRCVITETDNLDLCDNNIGEFSPATGSPYGRGCVSFSDSETWDVFHLLTYSEGRPMVVYFDSNDYPSIEWIEEIIAPALSVLNATAQFDDKFRNRDESGSDDVPDAQIPF